MLENSRGMFYTQDSNRRHGRAGHVFQGRFKAILVQKQAYLLELSRYVVLNPVRAQMVNDVKEWKWSSYIAFCDKDNKPPWLETDWILSQFSNNRSTAIRRYNAFIREGIDSPPVWGNIKRQIYLGTEEFIDSMLDEVKKGNQRIDDIPQLQVREKSKSLSEYENACKDRNHAIREAFASGGYTMKAIGDYFDLHYTSVSRIVNAQQ